MTVGIKKRCTIISNLLNNVIEACEKIQEDKRIIEFEIVGYNSQIFISVCNSYDMESIINQKQKFITTKEDKLNHGIGLENVRRTVKKYDGDMRISQENERFIAINGKYISTLAQPKGVCHSERKEYSEYANNDFDHIGARYHYIKL